MDRRWLVWIAAVVLMVAAAGAGAALAYQGGFMAGAAHGAAAATAAAETGATPGPLPPGMYGYGPWAYGWRPWGFGFGLFGFLGMLLLVFLFVGLLRAALWGGRWGRPGGAVGRGPWEGHLRALHDEWHSRTGEPAPGAQ